MVQSIEVRGGKGSIKVGTSGTISALMTRELESIKCRSQAKTSSGRKPPTNGGVAKMVQPRRTSNEVIGSRSGGGRYRSSNHNKNLEHIQKTKHNIQKNNHRIPMLGSENIALEGTPNREKASTRKVSYIVEIVDVKCGNPDRWSNPIKSRFKKLGFSKLSQSIG
ncbi:hypothetical protein C5167_039251 [Papaver somniferum]|uniref:Uncharacterized protein n=1 Tax=Papaver somniferum TaxID=3469 RepID=A0A4Y7IF38_PAPSO|nr:uncharacterized protein LOC113304683 [Papaver somniferum]RZC46301.1 hypothetical protein C5167_039251 [Papaver somniferum]